VLLINEKTGLANYYEYGRYSNVKDPRLVGHALPGKGGNVRKISVSDVVIGKDGLPTEESLKRVYNELAKRAGGGITPSTTYYDDVDFAKAKQYILDIANDKNREHYSITSNSCMDFAGNAIRAGR
jgi:hypothetical protein